MKKTLGFAVVTLALAMVSAPLAAQDTPTLGDRTTPLRQLGGDDNVGISNAVLRSQDEVRALRVVVDASGTRAMHAHSDVRFHLFIPISAPMELRLADGVVEVVQPWHPYYLEAGTQHGFHNPGSEPVEVMEIFVQ